MALIQVNYMSKALFRIVPLNVILPVDRFDGDTDRYLTDKDHKYKTLYLLHGLLGNYTDWVSQTRIQKWAEEKNLAVVMPSGDNAFYFKSRTPWNDYETFIGEELPAITRRMFPLSDKREDTFIAGLSMGGYGAIRNGIVFSDTFSHIAGLSSALHIFDDLSEEADIGLFDNLEEASKTNLNPKIAANEMFREKKSMLKSLISRMVMYLQNLQLTKKRKSFRLRQKSPSLSLSVTVFSLIPESLFVNLLLKILKAYSGPCALLPPSS